MTRLRVVVVGMVDSIHLARWLQQFTEEPIDFLLFSSGPNRKVHESIRKLLEGGTQASYQMFYRSSVISLVVWLIDFGIRKSTLRGYILRRAITKFKPHFLHALEFQQAGYVTLAACSKMGNREFEIVVTNYGSDIFFFQKKASHVPRIRALLRIADRYASECNRDVDLALRFGFEGRVMPVYPNSGGFSLEHLSRELHKFQDRDLLVVKGYHGWSGRALIALGALSVIRKQIESYRVVVIQSDAVVRVVGFFMRRFLGVNISCHKKGSLPRDSVLKLYDHAVAYVGLSVTDGISTSMLEAMGGGAIPVQTASACCDEWFTDTGVRVEELSVSSVSMAILSAIEIARSHPNLLRNREAIARKALEGDVQSAALEFYR